MSEFYIFSSIDEVSGNPIMNSESRFISVNPKQIIYNPRSKSRLQDQDLPKYLNQKFMPTPNSEYLYPGKVIDPFSQIYKCDHKSKSRLRITQTSLNTHPELSDFFISNKMFCTFETALALALIEAWARGGFSLDFDLELNFGICLKFVNFGDLYSEVADFSTPSLRKFLNFLARLGNFKDLQKVADQFGVAVVSYKVSEGILTQEVKIPENIKKVRIPLIRILEFQEFFLVVYTKKECLLDGFNEKGEAVKSFESTENNESFYEVRPQKVGFLNSVFKTIGSVLERSNDLQMKTSLVQELSVLLQSFKSEPVTDQDMVKELIFSLNKSKTPSLTTPQALYLNPSKNQEVPSNFNNSKSQNLVPVNFLSTQNHPGILDASNKPKNQYFVTTHFNTIENYPVISKSSPEQAGQYFPSAPIQLKPAENHQETLKSTFNSIKPLEKNSSKSIIEKKPSDFQHFKEKQNSLNLHSFEKNQEKSTNFQKKSSESSQIFIAQQRVESPKQVIIESTIPNFFESKKTLNLEFLPEFNCPGCNKKRYLQVFHSACSLCTPCIAHSVLERRCINCRSENVLKECKKFLESRFNCYCCSDICGQFTVSTCGCIICKNCIDKGKQEDHQSHKPLL